MRSVNGAEYTADIRQDASAGLKCMGEEGTENQTPDSAPVTGRS